MSFLKLTLVFSFILFTSLLNAQTEKTIKLNKPDLSRGYNVMKALSLRASETDFDTKELSLQDISDLLWAANGINRPETGKRTAPSAINAQDIDVYVCLKKGFYLYDAPSHLLNLIAEGDFRKFVAGSQEKFALAPVMLLIVSDISRFTRGADSTKKIWAAEDGGIVSQNIAIFCAGMGMSTRPRATMDQAKLREILKLKDSQIMVLNNPVAYKK